MSVLVSTRPAPTARGPLSALKVISDWRARRRSRLALARLDAHLLQDIGLSVMTAETETEKPFWIA